MLFRQILVLCNFLSASCIFSSKNARDTKNYAYFCTEKLNDTEMRRYKGLYLLSFLVLLLAFSSAQNAFTQNHTFTVVIDPGHGGRDPGAVGANSMEKNIVLAVGLKLGELIKQNHPEVRVIYTRTTDVFVPLHERAAIANRANANLFISIHCNAIGGARAATAQGAEVWVLGMDRSEENLAVAQRENSVIFLEEDYAIRYGGFDPNDPVSYIIFEFLANEHLDRSIQFASLVQNQLVSRANRINRGVRQAGFLVLREVAMPSVLIELGFISNRAEERFMMSAEGQRILANSIYEGFRQYLADHHRRTSMSILSPQNLPQTPSTVVGATPEAIVEIDLEVFACQEAATETTTESEPMVEQAPQNQGVREYRIQFLSTSRQLPAGAPEFRGLSPVSFYRDGATYRFTYGSATDRSEINRLLPRVRQKFRDAFIIEMMDGQRVR